MIPRLKPDLSLTEIVSLFSINRKTDIPEYEAAFSYLMNQSHAVFA